MGPKDINRIHQEKYLQFTGWNFATTLIATTQSVLSTHSMLSVIGKADTDLMVSAQYIGKDIIGQLGGLLYIHKTGNKADKDPKKFLKNSLLIHQMSLYLECATPFLYQESPMAFVGMASIANMGKNICFIGFGAINVKVINQLSVNENDGKLGENVGENVGEIYAKICIINTIGSTIGMSIGLLIVGILPDHSQRFGILPILTIARIYTMNKAIDGII